jgi:hypothetical protein
MEHTNTLCGQNAVFVNVIAGGTYSNHWASKCLKAIKLLDIGQCCVVCDALTLLKLSRLFSQAIPQPLISLARALLVRSDQ